MSNILLIGLGNIGQIHYKNLSKRKNLKIFVYDQNKVLMKKFIDNSIQNEYEFEKILNNIKINSAIVASPTTTHKDYSIKLSKKLIPHIIEKPLCLSKTDYLNIYKYAKKNNVFVMCGFVERFHEAVQTINDKLSNQKIIHYSSIRNSIPSDKDRQIDEIKFDVLIHDLDLFNLFNKKLNFEKTEIKQNYEFTFATYHSDKLSAILTANRLSHKKRRQINIVTDKYEYQLDLVNNLITRYEYKYFKNSNYFPQPFIKTNEEITQVKNIESIYNEQSYFLKNLKKGFDTELFNTYEFSHFALFKSLN